MRYNRSTVNRVDSPPRAPLRSDDVRPLWLEVDLDALHANYTALRRMVAPETKLIASVKANAYGMVSPRSGERCRGPRRLRARDRLLRGRAGPESGRSAVKILLFACQLPEASGQLLANDLIPTIYNLETARAVSEQRDQLPPPCM